MSILARALDVILRRPPRAPQELCYGGKAYTWPACSPAELDELCSFLVSCGFSAFGVEVGTDPHDPTKNPDPPSISLWYREAIRRLAPLVGATRAHKLRLKLTLNNSNARFNLRLRPGQLFHAIDAYVDAYGVERDLLLPISEHNPDTLAEKTWKQVVNGVLKRDLWPVEQLILFRMKGGAYSEDHPRTTAEPGKASRRPASWLSSDNGELLEALHFGQVYGNELNATAALATYGRWLRAGHSAETYSFEKTWREPTKMAFHRDLGRLFLGIRGGSL